MRSRDNGVQKTQTESLELLCMGIESLIEARMNVLHRYRKAVFCGRSRREVEASYVMSTREGSSMRGIRRASLLDVLLVYRFDNVSRLYPTTNTELETASLMLLMK